MQGLIKREALRSETSKTAKTKVWRAWGIYERVSAWLSPGSGLRVGSCRVEDLVTLLLVPQGTTYRQTRGDTYLFRQVRCLSRKRLSAAGGGSGGPFWRGTNSLTDANEVLSTPGSRLLSKAITTPITLHTGLALFLIRKLRSININICEYKEVELVLVLGLPAATHHATVSATVHSVSCLIIIHHMLISSPVISWAKSRGTSTMPRISLASGAMKRPPKPPRRPRSSACKKSTQSAG